MAKTDSTMLSHEFYERTDEEMHISPYVNPPFCPGHMIGVVGSHMINVAEKMKLSEKSG